MAPPQPGDPPNPGHLPTADGHPPSPGLDAPTVQGQTTAGDLGLAAPEDQGMAALEVQAAEGMAAASVEGQDAPAVSSSTATVAHPAREYNLPVVDVQSRLAMLLGEATSSQTDTTSPVRMTTAAVPKKMTPKRKLPI